MREDWIECKLGDVIEIISGKNQKNVLNSNGKYPIYGSGGIIGRADEYLCDSGSTIIGRKGTINSPIYVKEKFWNVDTAFGFYPFEILSNRLLYFFCLSFNFKALDKSTTIPSLAKRDLLQIEFSLPPFPIQKAIVKKIEELFSSLDSGIADLKKAQEQLVIYRQAVLKKAFEGELTNSEMRKEKLSSLSTKIGDGLHGTPKYDEKGTYFFINGNNLNNGKIFIKPETKKVNKEEYLKHQKDLNDKTVFVSINGTIGNTAFYNNEPVILGKSACYINLKNEVDKKYLRFNFLSSEFINYALKNATGSTIKNVGLKTMRVYLVPLPKDKQEQIIIVREIESRLSVCDKVEESLKESLEKAKALRQSILKKAFEGKLLSAEELAKCKADKDYEPASVLLERIKKEKKK